MLKFEKSGQFTAVKNTVAQQSSLSGKQAYKEAEINRKNSKAVKGIDKLTKKCKIKRFTLWFWVVSNTLMRFDKPKRRVFNAFPSIQFQNEKK